MARVVYGLNGDDASFFEVVGSATQFETSLRNGVVELEARRVQSLTFIVNLNRYV